MILIVLSGLGLVAGLLRGGAVGNLAGIRVRYAWLPLIAFALQASFILFARDPASIPVWMRVFILLVTHAGLLSFLVLNRHLPGARLLLAGAVLNAAVMLANGGFMPVTPQALARSGHTGYIVYEDGVQYVRRSKDIVLEREDTRLWFLSDVFGIPEPLPFASNFSPGDLLIGVGAAWLTYRGLHGPARARRRDSPPLPGPAARESRGHLRSGEELRHEPGCVAHDDRPGADRPAVPGRTALQSARSDA